MRWLVSMVWLVMLIGVVPKGEGKNYIAQTWLTDEGLPQNSVNALFFGRDGYLWVGTFNGLARFDGVKFETYRASKSSGLPGSRIVFLGEDGQGQLWVGTEEGALAYQLGPGRFRAVEMPKNGGMEKVTSMATTADGAIWFTWSDGRVRRFVDGRFEENREGWGLEWYAANGVVADKAGKLWLGTNQGLLEWRDGRFRPTAEEELKLGSVARVFPSRTGGIWAVSSGMIKLVAEGRIKRQAELPPMGNSKVVGLVEGEEAEVWVATSVHGVMRIQEGKNRSEFTVKEGLSQDAIRSICRDAEGNFWVGTEGNGLNRLRRGPVQMIKAPAAFSGQSVTDCAQDPGSGLVWFAGSGAGLWTWDPATLGVEAQTNALNERSHVTALHFDQRGRLLLAIQNRGLFERSNGRVNRLVGAEASSMMVQAIHADKSGRVWFGGRRGLGYLDGETLKMHSLEDGMSSLDVRTITEDKVGTIWVGTAGGGLNRFSEGKWSVLRETDGLPSDDIWSLHMDRRGVLWIGTFGAGMACLEKGRIRRISTREGLPDDVINQIAEDVSGNIWTSTFNGIARIGREKEGELRPSIRIFGKDDGLASLESAITTHPQGLCLRDGRLLFPTSKGVAWIDPSTLRVNRRPPPVVIESIKIDDAEPELPRQSLEVPPEHGRLEISYTALGFSAPDKIRFRYKLEGLEKDWIDAGGRRVAYYSHVRPGRYFFQVIAANEDGYWSSTGTGMRIVVVPFYYQTNWFVAMVTVAALLMVFGSLRYLAVRKYRLQMASLERESAVERERTRIARDIHDDLGASLTQITLLSELARRDVSDDSIQPGLVQHLRQISAKARSLTRAMDEIVWAVNPRNDSLEAFLSYFAKYATDYLAAANIRCRLDLPNEQEPWPLSSETRHHLFLVVKEALNNIVKHSEASEVWIRLGMDGTRFVLRIEDNGRGMCGIENGCVERTAAGNGVGNMTSRIHNLEGSFSLSANQPKGTVAEIRLDLQRSEN